MSFDIPYQLNADISDFKSNIQYISSDNGIDFYRAIRGFISHLLGFSVHVANLYFFEGNLITVYMQLTKHGKNIDEVKKALDDAILINAKSKVTDTGLMYYWQDDRQFLGLIRQGKVDNILIYHSLNKFNVYYK